MLGILNRDKDNKITSPISQYQPTQEIGDFTDLILEDYGIGYQIQRRPFTEFNDKSLLERMDMDQKAFNSYVMPQSQDPDEEWRWNGVRPITRNKVISIAAHIVSRTVYPNVFAQNEADEEDKAAAEVMKLQIEWNIRNSDYELSFLYAIISALVNPVAYLQADYSKVFQIIKERNERGEITTKKMMDEMFSGFHALVVPADEILISNPYEFELQKQRFIVRKRFIDYDEAKNRFNKHKNLQYIQLGVSVLYDKETAMFYDQQDDELQSLIEWITYYNRQEDIEVNFLNGIYMGDNDANANPIKHRDNQNRPKYPYAKFGYEPIDEKRFYFYKSLVAKLADDQELIDQMWRLTMDNLFMQGMPALAGFGTGILSSKITFPGTVSNFGKDADVRPITGKNDVSGLMVGLSEIEASMEESSQAKIREGQLSKGQTTAFEVRRAEINSAIIQFGIFGKMISQVIKDFGGLMIDDLILYQTTLEVEEMLDGETKLKYRSFLLPNQTEKGKTITRKIVFDKEMIGKKISEKERIKQSFQILKEQGGLEGKQKIYRVNPFLFSRLKFMGVVDADTLLPRNEATEKEEKLAIYDKAIASQNPYLDMKEITRDFFIGPSAKGNSDKYMAKEQQIPQSIQDLLQLNNQKGGEMAIASKGIEQEGRSQEQLLEGILQKGRG